MKDSNRRLAAGVILLLVMGGVGILLNYMAPSTAYAESDSKAAGVNKSIVTANTGFAIRLLRELQKEQPGENIFISPLSVSVALAITYNGANGTTREAMRSTLGFEGMSDEEINTGFKQLIESLLSADKEVNLNIGDSVWVRSSFAEAVNPMFTDALRKYYNSEVFTKPFDASTVDEVNSWVSEETKGKISKLLDSIDPDNVMFLINAIYFKGDWVNKFDETKTGKAEFTTSEGSVVEVDTMHRTGGYMYYGDEQVQVARLPYGRDKIAMYVFLPASGVELQTFASSLTEIQLDGYLAKLDESELNLSLPKLKLEYGKVDLKDALTSLGMGVAFNTQEADLTRIADVEPENLYIAFVDHKAVVDINEKGTEAAAATNVGISITSMPLTTAFTVDRSYMFVIRDDRSGSILFSGLISDPTQQTSP